MEMCVHDGPGLHAVCAAIGQWYVYEDDAGKSKNVHFDAKNNSSSGDVVVVTTGGGTHSIRFNATARELWREQRFGGQHPFGGAHEGAFASPYFKLATAYNLRYRLDSKARFGLTELLDRIKSDPKYASPTRRQLGMLDVARKDVIPAMIVASDPAVFLEAVKVLKSLTTPLESLIPGSSQAALLKSIIQYIKPDEEPTPEPSLSELAIGGSGDGAADATTVNWTGGFSKKFKKPTPSTIPSNISCCGDGASSGDDVYLLPDIDSSDVLVDPGGGGRSRADMAALVSSGGMESRTGGVDGSCRSTPESSFSGTDSATGGPIALELAERLSDLKLAFVDARSTKPLVDKLNSIFSQSKREPGAPPPPTHNTTSSSMEDNKVRLTDTDRETVYQILMLVRNILHLEHRETFEDSEEDSTSDVLQSDFLALVARSSDANGLSPYLTGRHGSVTSRVKRAGRQPNGHQHGRRMQGKAQNILLGNLFAQNFDKALLELLEHPDLPFWSGPLTEVISLLYKDQHVATLHTLLAKWLEYEVTDSTSEDENNTSMESGNKNNYSPLFSSSNMASESSDSDKPRTPPAELDDDQQEKLTNRLELMQVTSLSGSEVSFKSSESVFAGEKSMETTSCIGSASLCPPNHPSALPPCDPTHCPTCKGCRRGSFSSVRARNARKASSPVKATAASVVCGTSVPKGSNKKRQHSPGKGHKRQRLHCGSLSNLHLSTSIDYIITSPPCFSPVCDELQQFRHPEEALPPMNEPAGGAQLVQRPAQTPGPMEQQEQTSASAVESNSGHGPMWDSLFEGNSSQQSKAPQDNLERKQRCLSMESLDSGACCSYASGQSASSKGGPAGASQPDFCFVTPRDVQAPYSAMEAEEQQNQPTMPHADQQKHVATEELFQAPAPAAVHQRHRHHHQHPHHQEQTGDSSSSMSNSEQICGCPYACIRHNKQFTRPDADSGQSGNSGNSSDEKYGNTPNEALAGVHPPIPDSPSSTEEDLRKTRAELVNRRPPHHRSEGPGKKSQTGKDTNYAQLRSNRKKHRLAAQRRRTLERHQSGTLYPTDEEISLLLRDFTVEFLQNSYGRLVGILANELPFSLYSQVKLHLPAEMAGTGSFLTAQTSGGNPSTKDVNSMSGARSVATSNVDPAHFLWMITYFLKFATQIPVEFAMLRPVLSPQVVSFLVYQGLYLSEEAKEMALRDAEKQHDRRGFVGKDSPPFLRRLHLVVAALREFVQSVDAYSKSSKVPDADKEKIRALQKFLLRLRDLRSLLAYLIRTEVELHPICTASANGNKMDQDIPRASPFLMDLVLTNHMLLRSLPNFATTSQNDDSLAAKVNQQLHATAVRELAEYIESLATADIISQYARVLATFATNSADVNDAVFTLFHHVVVSLDKPEALFHPDILHAFADMWDNKFDLCEEWSDVLAIVMKLFMDKVVKPARGESSTGCGSPTPSLFDESPDWKNAQAGFAVPRPVATAKKPKVVTHGAPPLVSKLIKTCPQEALHWLEWAQSFCLQTACVKAYLGVQGSVGQMPTEKSEGNKQIWNEETELLLHPVLLYHCLAKRNIPLVAWTEKQEAALRNEVFLEVLQWIGLEMPVTTGKSFPRVPSEWPCKRLFEAAAKLAPATPDLAEVETVVKRASSPLGSQSMDVDDNSETGSMESMHSSVTTITKQDGGDRGFSRSHALSRSTKADTVKSEKQDSGILSWTDAVSRVPTDGLMMDFDDEEYC